MSDRSPGGVPEPIDAVPVRHVTRWVAAAALTVVVASLLVSLWNNPNLDRRTIGEYLFSDLVFSGIAVTLQLTVLSMVIGIAGGVALAVMRLSDNPVLKSVSWTFIWLFRGTPILVQLLFWGFLGALYSELTIGLPFTDLSVTIGETNVLVTPFLAALLGLGLNEAAYAAEIVRGGLLGVDRGQVEAAQSLGFTSAQTTQRIVLPQAMRTMIPPFGNETITMLKSTALVVVIGGSADLLANIQNAYAQSFLVIPLLVVASIWYLVLTSILSVGQYFLERRFGRSEVGAVRGRGLLAGIGPRGGQPSAVPSGSTAVAGGTR